MRALTMRRPEVLFLAALLVLALTLAARALNTQPAASPAIDPAAVAPIALGDARSLDALQERIQQNPDDTAAYALLGQVLLLQVRETADPSLYTKAQQAFDEALKRDPNQLEALIGQGTLSLARHEFAEALEWGEQARAVNPRRAQVYGVIADALVELGRYDEAEAAMNEMVQRRPDLASYSRVSYLRELYGDVPGAIDAMKRALSAGGGENEATLWTQVQLGNLYFNSGDLAQAEANYAQALQRQPEYSYAIAGIARVRAAQEKQAEAITIYERVIERLPLPEFVLALGELYQATGREREARTQYELVRAIQQLNADAGMNVDLELALFDADHGSDPQAAVDRARAAYQARPSIYAADALAWALHRVGAHEEAWRYSQQVLRLGTRDAALHYRAGAIAYARGDMAEARRLLSAALAINPHFSPLHAPQAQEMLAHTT